MWNDSHIVFPIRCNESRFDDADLPIIDPLVASALVNRRV
jgi:hypothetical protein